MEKNRDIDKLVKQSFDKQAPAAPDLWNKVSAELDEQNEPAAAGPDSKLDQKVKQSFEERAIKAPAHVWAQVESRLEPQVAVAAPESATNNTGWYARRLVAAVLLLLLSGGAFWFIQQQSLITRDQVAESTTTKTPAEQQAVPIKADEAANNQSIRGATTQPGQITESLALSPSLSVDKSKQETAKSVAINSGRPVVLGAGKSSDQALASASSALGQGMNMGRENAGLTPTDQGDNTNSLFAENTNLAVAALNTTKANHQLVLLSSQSPKLATYQPVLPGLIVLIDSLREAPVLLAEAEAKHNKNQWFKNLEVGTTLAYNNSWLLNNETRSSFNQSSLIATDRTYKKNWGLTLNYALSHRQLFSLEAQFINRAGQEYRMFRGGQYLQNGVELRYTKLTLQHQFNFWRHGKNLPSYITLTTGLYGSKLKQKVGEISQEESRYANLDYGLKVALGRETNFGRAIIGYGVMADRGLKNIFDGAGPTPAEFNKTYLLNVGPYINVRYQFLNR
jgi:hypothetical protein